MTITTATDRDVEKLKKIARDAISESVSATESIKADIVESTENHIDRNIASLHCVFLKHETHQPTGFILIQEYWNLSDLFVAPDEQGKGIGSRLLLKALCHCNRAGERRHVRVNSAINAEHFYRKHGFTAFVPETTVPPFVVPLIYHFSG